MADPFVTVSSVLALLLSLILCDVGWGAIYLPATGTLDQLGNAKTLGGCLRAKRCPDGWERTVSPCKISRSSR